MIQIDKEIKEKRNAEYNMKARKYPAYLCLTNTYYVKYCYGS